MSFQAPHFGKGFKVSIIATDLRRGRAIYLKRPNKTITLESQK